MKRWLATSVLGLALSMNFGFAAAIKNSTENALDTGIAEQPEMGSLDERISELVTELELSAEQADQLRVIYTDQAEALRMLFSGQAREQGELRGDFRELQQQTYAQIEAVLNDEQREVYSRYRATQTAERQDQFARALLDYRINMLEERLELSPDQLTELRPILEAQIRDFQPFMQRNPNGEPASRHERRQTLRQLRSQQQNYDQRIEALLSEEQAEAYREYRDEQREQMRSLLRRRQG